MKKKNAKMAVLGFSTALVAVGTLVGAAVLAEINNNGFGPVSSQTQYSSNATQNSQSNISSKPENSSQEASENSSEESSEASSNESAFPMVETGIYYSGENSIVISHFEQGFIEGNANCFGITMEFSGQMVENTLVSTGIDSLNNTVEITLVFEQGFITVNSKPIIRYEESADYLIAQGEFKK